MKKIILLVVLLSLIFIGYYYYSNQNSYRIFRSFYYWKSVYNLFSYEEKLLDTLQIKRLYVKYFDVDWDNDLGQPIPLATVRFVTSCNKEREIIPTIYLTNNTLLNLKTEQIAELTVKIATRITQINNENNIDCKEIQFDCDWTEKTRSKYFLLLEKIRDFFPKKKYLLSATIRLHQVKYYLKTGVPPVDRGMLMFYNVGKVNDTTIENSIFNSDDASKYVEYVKDYLLPLDVALPVFTWGVHLRDGEVISLVNNLKTEDVLKNSLFRNVSDSKYKANDGFFFRGEYFIKGDILRMEEITPEICNNAINLLLPNLKNSNFTVVFYHFDSSNTSRYEIKDFENLYNRFR